MSQYYAAVLFSTVVAALLQDWGRKVADGDMLDPERPVVVVCKAGIRSMQLCQWLDESAGFAQVYNVRGGFLEYARQVDDGVSAY